MSTILSDYFGETLGPVVSLILVVALVALAGWVIWMLVRRVRSGLFIGGGSGAHAPRLSVIDAVPVDTQRRLVLVRRDDTEHLLMIGGPSDIVVESGIRRQQPAPRAQQPAAHPAPPASPPAAAEPAQLPRTPAVAARDALIEAERGRPVRQPAPDISDRRTAPSVLPPVAAPPAPPAPPAAQLPISAAPTQAPAPAMRAEPQFAPDQPAAVPDVEASSASSKASADLDRILADLDMAKSTQR